MRADNSLYLRRAARERAERTQAAASTALEQFVVNGAPISVARLANAASVSRSWIYTQPELLRRINDLATQRPPQGSQRQPGNRATSASLHRRLELAHDRITQLTGENRQLREELAAVYGKLRAQAALTD